MIALVRASDGLRKREWLYTRRTIGSIVRGSAITGLFAIGSALAIATGSSGGPNAAYIALLFAYASAFFRANARVEVEAKTGVGILYLTAGAPLRTSIALKALWESLVSFVFLMPVAGILIVVGAIPLTAPSIAHLLISPMTLAMMTLVVTCLAYSPEGKESAVVLVPLTLGAAILHEPSVGLLSHVDATVLDVLIPTLNVFGGFSELAGSESPGYWRIPIQGVHLVGMLLLAERLYRRMLRRTLV